MWGCNPSTSPHSKAEDLRFMYLSEPHLAVYIANIQGQVVDSIVKNSADGNVYFDTPEWSTHWEYATVVGSARSIRPPFDIYIMRLSDDSLLRVLDGNYYWPHLWIEGSSQTLPPKGMSTGIRQSFALQIRNRRISIAGVESSETTLNINNLNGVSVFRCNLSAGQRSVIFNGAPGIYTVTAKRNNGATVSAAFTLIGK
jgi:hypothetical protein